MTTENIPLEPEKKEPDSVLESFDTFLKEAGEGWTLVVIREEPKNLMGFLEEISIHDSENPIDLKYLAETWGGDVLRISLRGPDGKFHRRLLLQMRSYPPRVHGKPIYAGHPQAEPKQIDPLDIIKLSRELTPQPQPQRDMLSEIAPILKIIMDRSQPQQLPPSPSANIMDLMGALGAMRDFVQPPPEGSDAIATSLAKVAEVFMTSQMAKPQQQPAPPRPHVVSAINPQPQVQSQPRPQVQSESIPNLSDDDILKIMKEKLSKLSGEQISYLYLDVLEGMPDDKREEALGILDQEIGTPEDDDTPTTDPIPTPIPGKQPVTGPRDPQSDRKGDKKIG